MELCLADTQPAVRNDSRNLWGGGSLGDTSLPQYVPCSTVSSASPSVLSSPFSPVDTPPLVSRTVVLKNGNFLLQPCFLGLSGMGSGNWLFHRFPQEFLLELFLSPLTHPSSEPLKARGLCGATLFLEPVRKSLPVADNQRLLRLWMSDPV